MTQVQHKCSRFTWNSYNNGTVTWNSYLEQLPGTVTTFASINDLKMLEYMGEGVRWVRGWLGMSLIEVHEAWFSLCILTLTFSVRIFSEQPRPTICSRRCMIFSTDDAFNHLFCQYHKWSLISREIRKVINKLNLPGTTQVKFTGTTQRTWLLPERI